MVFVARKGLVFLKHCIQIFLDLVRTVVSYAIGDVPKPNGDQETEEEK